MGFDRRFFLKSGAVALAGLGSSLFDVPRFLVRAASTTPGRRKTLVVVFLRGAADGLNIVVPHGEPRYYELRPNIAIPRPGRGGGAIDLDGGFGLHPALSPLRPLWDNRTLALVHAAGSPASTRSHFDAQDFMESGTPGVKSTADGWLNRYMQGSGKQQAGDFRAVAVTPQLPRILAGRASALAIPQLSRFGIQAGGYTALIEHGLRDLYESSDDALLRGTARESLEAMQRLRRVEPEKYRPAHGARYPGGGFGRSMLQIAQLIKSDVGLEIAFAEIGGWDHHVNEGSVDGPLAGLLRQLGGGLGAFARDLGDRLEDVVLVTLSEFGRTAAENGSRGTDHGHANAMFVLGGPVRGGKIYGKWPGLQQEQLHEQRDLALTSDFRDVLGALLIGHLGAADVGVVFPGHATERKRFRGIV